MTAAGSGEAEQGWPAGHPQITLYVLVISADRDTILYECEASGPDTGDTEHSTYHALMSAMQAHPIYERHTAAQDYDDGDLE